MDFLDEKEEPRAPPVKKSRIASVICIAFNQDRVNFLSRIIS